MDPFDNWEQMNVLQRVTMLTSLIDETKDKGLNTREAEGLMQLATSHIDSEDYDSGNQLLQKTYFSLKRLREQHLDDPTMVGGTLEQPPPPPPDDKTKSGRPRPTKGRCNVCRGEGLIFRDDGTGECPDCKRKFFWDKSKIPPPEPEVEKGEPEEAPVEGPIEMTEVETEPEPAPIGELVKEEAPIEFMTPEPEPSVPADPLDQGIEVTETSPPMAKTPPPPEEINLMKVEDEKTLEAVSVVVPKEEIPEEPEDEPPPPEDKKEDFDIDSFFDMGEEGGDEPKPPEPSEGPDTPEETPGAPPEVEPPKEQQALPESTMAEETPPPQGEEEAGLPDPADRDTEDPADMFRADGPPPPVPKEEGTGPSLGESLAADGTPGQEPAEEAPPTESSDDQDKQLMTMAAEKGQEAFEKMEEKKNQGCDISEIEALLAKSREHMAANDYMSALNTIGEAITKTASLEPAAPPPAQEPTFPEPVVAGQEEDPAAMFAADAPPIPEEPAAGEEELPDPNVTQDQESPPQAPYEEYSDVSPAYGGSDESAAYDPPAQTPLLVAACWNCQGDVPVYTEERPIVLKCPGCGEEVQLD